MKTKVTFLLALCVLTALSAVTPRDRRLADPVKLKDLPKQICDPQTPCAWSIYSPHGKVEVPGLNVTNNYCECATGLKCLRDEDDVTVNSYILRCRTPEGETPS